MASNKTLGIVYFKIAKKIATELIKHRFKEKYEITKENIAKIFDFNFPSGMSPSFAFAESSPLYGRISTKLLNTISFNKLTTKEINLLRNKLKPESFYLKPEDKFKEINDITDKVFQTPNIWEGNDITAKDLFDNIVKEYEKLNVNKEKLEKVVKPSISEKISEELVKSNLSGSGAIIKEQPRGSKNFPDIFIKFKENPSIKEKAIENKFKKTYHINPEVNIVQIEVKSGRNEIKTSELGEKNLNNFKNIPEIKELFEKREPVKISKSKLISIIKFLFKGGWNQKEDLLVFHFGKSANIYNLSNDLNSISENDLITLSINKNKDETRSLQIKNKGSLILSINFEKDQKEVSEPKKIIPAVPKEVPKPEESTITIEGKLKQAVDFINKNRIPYRKSDFLAYLFEPDKKLIPISILDLEKKIRNIVDLKSLRNETLKLQNKEEIKNFLKDKKYLREWKLKERKVKNLFEYAYNDIKEKNKWLG